jgi:hypothetical protein
MDERPPPGRPPPRRVRDDEQSLKMTFSPACFQCGSVRHAGLCSSAVSDLAKDDVRARKKAKCGHEKAKVVLLPEDIKRGLTVWDVCRPVREAVPNATIRIPKKVINRSFFQIKIDSCDARGLCPCIFPFWFELLLACMPSKHAPAISVDKTV